MSPRSIALPSVHAVAFATLMGMTLLAAPLSTACADTGSHPQLAQAATMKSQAAKDATGLKPETVEQRIASLHATLKITPDEESKWDAVAQVMRDNAATMEKLVAKKKLTLASEDMTALDDLMTYQQFAQAHVEGLKNLTSAFQALYDSMPSDQKKIVDEAFQKYGSQS